MVHWFRSRPTWGVAAVAIALLVMAGLLVFPPWGDAPDAAAPTTQQGTPGPSVTADQQAVQDVVDRFVEALATGDAATLYSLQTEAYRNACSEEAFRDVVAAMSKPALSGPVRVEIDGDVAGARLLSGESTPQPVLLALNREQDGTWRVVAQASGQCTR